MWNRLEDTGFQRPLGLLIGGMGMAGLLGLSVLGTGGTATVAGTIPTATIQIANFRFSPPDLTVTAGTKVIWKNADDSPHRVADVNGSYASAALDTDDSFSRAFAIPGVYKYLCSIHPYMKGEITVKPATPKS